MSEQKKKLVAYHEAGHAILGALMPLGRVSETSRFARLVKNEGSQKCHQNAGSTSTLLHEKINKDCQVLFVGDSGFLHFLRVVQSDYGKPRNDLRLL